MDAPKPERENRLLIGSGVLAIALTAMFAVREFGFGPSIALFVLFTIVFLALSHADRLGLSNAYRRAGLAVLLLLTILSWLIQPMDITLILTVVMMAEAPSVLNRRDTWLLLLLTNVIFALVFFGYWQAGGVWGTWVSMIALQAFAVTSSLARVEERALKLKLFEQNKELIAARTALTQQSQLEERLRIAGDLHDGIGHQLTALRLQLEALSQVAPESMKPQLALSQTLSGDLLENIRAIVRRMAASADNDLQNLIDEMNAATPGVSISAEGSIPQLGADLRQQLVSCIKEGVSNAIRHGNATGITIHFSRDSILIDDNGDGVSPGTELGFGLQNLVSRLSPFGGKVELMQLEERGTRLAIGFAKNPAGFSST